MRYETFFPITLRHAGGQSEATEIRLVATDQHFEDDIPSLPCTNCKRRAPFFDFLHLYTTEDGAQLLLRQHVFCVHCRPRARVPVLLQKKMAVSLHTVRGEDNSPLRWFEKKKRRWKSVSKLQFRFMDKSRRPLKLALQPYDDRHHAHDGTPYEN